MPEKTYVLRRDRKNEHPEHLNHPSIRPWDRVILLSWRTGPNLEAFANIVAERLERPSPLGGNLWQVIGYIHYPDEEKILRENRKRGENIGYVAADYLNVRKNISLYARSIERHARQNGYNFVVKG